MKESYYKPSGQLTAQFFPYLLLFAAIAIPILSVAYIYSVYHISFVYFNILITVGCGGVLGCIIKQTVKMAKVRNPTVVIVCTIAAVIIMKYVQWCIYIPLVFDDAYGAFDAGLTLAERFQESLHLFVSPGNSYELAAVINEIGVWGISSSGSNGNITVHGAALLFVWIVEFMIMAYMAVIVARKQCSIPFSEISNMWYGEIEGKIETDVPENMDSFIHDIENGRFNELVQLVNTGKTGAAQFLSMTICEPPKGSVGEPCYISIAQTKIGKKDKKKTKTLVVHLAVDSQTVNTLLGRTAAHSDDALQV